VPDYGLDYTVEIFDEARQTVLKWGVGQEDDVKVRLRMRSSEGPGTDQGKRSYVTALFRPAREAQEERFYLVTSFVGH
jgi:hypothetical protein